MTKVNSPTSSTVLTISTSHDIFKTYIFVAAKETNSPSFDEEELESDEVQRVWQYLQLIKEEPERIQHFYYDRNSKRTSPAECLKTLIRFVPVPWERQQLSQRKTSVQTLNHFRPRFFHLGTVKPLISWVLLKYHLSLSGCSPDFRNWLPILIY